MSEKLEGEYLFSEEENPKAFEAMMSLMAQNANHLITIRKLQQKLDTYIQLAETKGKELEEAISIIKLIYEATSISAYIVSKEKIREFLNKLEKWK